MKTQHLKYYFLSVLFIWLIILFSLNQLSHNTFTDLYNNFNQSSLPSDQLQNIQKAHINYLEKIFLSIGLSVSLIIVLSYFFIRKKMLIVETKEQFLKNNEEKFRKYFEENRAIMLLIDPMSKKIANANDSAVKFYGYPKKELLSKTIYEINQLPKEEIDRKMKEALKKKSNYLEFQHKTADGVIKDVDIYASPFSFGKEQLMSIIVHDISAKKQLENDLIKSREKYKKTAGLLEVLFNTIPDIVIACNKDHELIKANTAGYQYWNKERDEQNEKDCRKFIDIYKKDELCVLDTVFESKEAIIKEKYDKSKNKWYELRAYPVFNESKEITQGILFIRDISEKKQFIDKLKYAKERAEESDRLKSSFLANMSHEIRTPMNAILGFTQLLMQSNISAENTKKFIDIIHLSGNHLLQIINDIIDISKIDAKQIKINKSGFDLNRLLHDIDAIFYSDTKLIKNKNTKLSIIIPEKPVFINTDRTRLEQILINLIGNALKFTPKGKVEVKYEIKNKEILFSVKDSGIGMTSEELKYVFDRFRQGDETNKRKFGGTGLGLSISKELAELLGGTIYAVSEKGKGSTFYFTIPYHKNSIKNIPKNTSIEQKPLHLKNKNILIVEDHPYSKLILIELLKPYGTIIHTAENGLEAIQICKNKAEIDLVLMDIQLPLLDGLEASKRIKKFRPDLIIIAQTANALLEDKEKYLSTACDDYISKPIEAEVLLNTLKQYLY